MCNHHKVIIIGSGPAGYTAAIYTARANLSPLVFEGNQAGGQLVQTTEVENFPGFPYGIFGASLMDNMREQALRFNTVIKSETVISVDLSKQPYTIMSNSSLYTCDALIIATGASAKWIGIKKDEYLNSIGGGVSACATCDGFFFKNKEVAVVGGGDTALEEAMFLSQFASKVTIIHRRDTFRASKVMQQRIMQNHKIVFKWNSVVVDILYNQKFTANNELVTKIKSLILKNITNNAESTLSVEGLFVAIGHTPNTSIFIDQLPMDNNGYLLVNSGSSCTKKPGVFACGDVQDPKYRQAITAAGSGCMAALDANRWLSDNNLI